MFYILTLHVDDGASLPYRVHSPSFSIRERHAGFVECKFISTRKPPAPGW